MTTIVKISERVLNLNTKFFVDIGASCATESSESELLVNNGWSGIMFECDQLKFNIQKEKMNGSNVTILSNKVTPENILKILSDNNTPDGFYLTLDIDGYDYFVLEKILSQYKPQVIVSEINEKIPPPVKFTVEYDPDYFWDGSHYYGYSLAMLEDLLQKYNYRILFLDYNNVVLEPGFQTESIDKIYKEGYLNKFDRPNKFYYNSDFEQIYTMDKESQLNFIRNKFISITNERQSNSGYQLDGREIVKRNFYLQ